MNFTTKYPLIIQYTSIGRGALLSHYIAECLGSKICVATRRECAFLQVSFSLEGDTFLMPQKNLSAEVISHMKKFLSIILSTIMTLTICSVFTSCASLNMKNSEVVLLGVTASTDYVEYKTQNEVQPRLASPYAMTADIKLMDDTEQDITPDLTNAYTIVYKPLDGGQISIYYTIVLDNPKDHYIMDFKFSCDKDVQIQYVDGNTASIKSRRVRWDEAYSRQGNYLATFNLILPDEATNPTTIRVSEMYYSDHADGSSKTIVNTNDKEVYKVYTLDGIYVEQTDCTIKTAEFEITKNEGLNVKSISFNDKELEFNNAKKRNTYTVNESGKLVIKYSYSQNIGDIPGIDKDEVVLEKNIEIFNKDWFQPYNGKYIWFDEFNVTDKYSYEDTHFYIMFLKFNNTYCNTNGLNVSFDNGFTFSFYTNGFYYYGGYSADSLLSSKEYYSPFLLTGSPCIINLLFIDCI